MNEKELRAAAALVRRWFHVSGRDYPWRDPSATPYVQVVSEVLLQRTRADAAARTATKLFGRYPDWDSLACAQTSTLKTILSEIGLQERRSVALKALAVARADLGYFPDNRQQLERLPAVGQYVASAILLFEHGRHEPLLDSNMARIIERFHGPREKVDIRHDPVLQGAARVLVASDPVTTNWALLDLGALVCKPRSPACMSCPLVQDCPRIGLDDGSQIKLDYPVPPGHPRFPHAGSVGH